MLFKLGETSVKPPEPEAHAALRRQLWCSGQASAQHPHGMEAGFSEFKTLDIWKCGWGLSVFSNLNVIAFPGEGLYLQKGPAGGIPYSETA